MDGHDSELRYCTLSRVLVSASSHRWLVGLSLRLALRLEGGQFYSGSAREVLRQRFGVTIGAYSYGACFTPGHFQRNTVVGRYASIGPGARAYSRNHPTDTLSTHPFFFNAGLGIVPEDTVSYRPLVIGHDVWLGANVVVTPSCRKIGIGAVLAAGSLVTRNVPDFAVVGGNPAQLLCYRFAPDLKRAILRSEWWNLAPQELGRFLPQIAEAVPSGASEYLPFVERLAHLARGDHGEGRANVGIRPNRVIP